MLKVGVVGGGHIVKHRHLPVFEKIHDVYVHAICDKEESTAKDVAQRFGIRHYYTSLAKMMEEDLNIVDICTPPQTHVSLAVEAMEAGSHVLVEKPLAMNAKQVDEMYRVSKKEHVKLCVLHQNLFNPAFQKAMHMYRRRVIGDLIEVDVGTFVQKDNYMCKSGDHWCHRLPGGIFFEILPHPIYLLQYFLKNSKPVSTLAEKIGNYPWMKYDETRVLMEADDGMGLVRASCNSPFHGDAIKIFGTKICLEVDLWGRSIIQHKPRTESPYSVGKNNLVMASQFLNLLGTTLSNSLTMAFGGVKVSAHYGFIRRFVNSIQTDGELPVTEEEARENVEIVERICREIDNLD